MDKDKVISSIIFTIQEMKEKLGPSNGVVTLYMPILDLSNKVSEREELLTCLRSDVSFSSIEYSIIDDRLCIMVPTEMCQKIENMPVSPVLNVMVNAVKDDLDINSLKMKLKAISDNSVWLDIDNGEFDHAVYFIDGTDPHIYCMRIECGHLIYHRFSKDDYLAFGYSL